MWMKGKGLREERKESVLDLRRRHHLQPLHSDEVGIGGGHPEGADDDGGERCHVLYAGDGQAEESDVVLRFGKGRCELCGEEAMRACISTQLCTRQLRPGAARADGVPTILLYFAPF